MHVNVPSHVDLGRLSSRSSEDSMPGDTQASRAETGLGGIGRWLPRMQHGLTHAPRISVYWDLVHLLETARIR